MRLTKEKYGVDSDDRKRGRKEQCSDKGDEERSMRGVRVTPWTQTEKEQERHDIHEGDGEKLTVKKEPRCVFVCARMCTYVAYLYTRFNNDT